MMGDELLLIIGGVSIASYALGSAAHVVSGDWVILRCTAMPTTMIS
jgi:hypothetical protein